MSEKLSDLYAPITVISAMMREADHQDRKHGYKQHTVPGWLLIMEDELQEARRAWVKGRGDADALCEILQVMTVGMRCLQQHGIVEREASDA
jgi:hypothetical protein